MYRQANFRAGNCDCTTSWLTNRLGGRATKGPGLLSGKPKGCLLKHMPVRTRIVFVYRATMAGGTKNRERGFLTGQWN